MISFVYAQDENNGIGYQNDLPWRLPHDLKFFKETTWGHTMVMGRKTFESMDCRLLPGRETVVLTSNPSYGEDIDGLAIVNSKEEIMEMAENEHLMVIGGAGIFLLLWDEVDEIIRTVIDESFPYDVQVPDIDEDEFELVKVVEGPVDEKNKYPHRYEWWHRKEK